jgi:predicted nucleic acid-binding protein
MVLLVADTSALVSLGTVANDSRNPLDLLLESHTVVVPEQVVDELTETASYDDASGEAAQAVLDRSSAFETRSVELDETFPLDDGENAAVTLANDIDAVQLLCDEFNRLALVHASLAETRLVTTPILLTALVRNDAISPDAADGLLTGMSDARSWSSNSYVERAQSTLRQQRDNEQPDPK